MANNDDQIAEWNGPMGERWAKMQGELDALTRPFGDAALRAAAIQPGEKVLDVGCGCGDSSLAIAALVGLEGQVTGVDVSRPMLAVAEQRRADKGFPHVRFTAADAATDYLPLGRDVIFSRFGVMFFDDPPPALAHIRKALKSGGRMAFCCWRTPKENPWAVVPLAAARQALGVEAPPADPYAPGPFAFADELRLRDMLEGAGFKDVVIQPYDHSVRLGANAADAAEGSIRFGPASRFIREMGEAAVAKVLPAMTESLKPFEKGGECAPPGATWIVTAKVV